jgi:transcriptional regulator with XRE-family HTH domain
MHNETIAPVSTKDPFAGLGEALLRLRKTRGLSQADLAEKAGMSKSMIAGYEAGRQQPSLQSLALLMRTLGCDLDELSSTLKSLHD